MAPKSAGKHRISVIGKLRNNFWFWYGGIAFIVVVVILWSYGKNAGKVDYSELYGIWRSDNPRYEKCYLVFDEVSLVIGAADNNAYVYFLQSVAKSKEGGDILYTFHTKNPEGYFYDFWAVENGKGIHFKNQPHVGWTKVKASLDQELGTPK